MRLLNNDGDDEEEEEEEEEEDDTFSEGDEADKGRKGQCLG